MPSDESNPVRFIAAHFVHRLLSKSQLPAGLGALVACAKREEQLAARVPQVRHRAFLQLGWIGHLRGTFLENYYAKRIVIAALRRYAWTNASRSSIFRT
jgi:hypothetical protein